ncbi:MAG: lytic transglycosylase domain-containing protein [Rhodospirillales bacterium]|nr:lytic transglycosylase domain-containing protein [Rhodospirillales bacterium]
MRPFFTLFSGPVRPARALVLALGLSLVSPAAGAEEPDPWQLCGTQAARVEQRYALPPHLLAAIARVESGRWSAREQAVLAWPWTVMAEGRGRFLPNRAAAVAEVKALKARGIRNIDVGCMQVNLKYHPEAFDSLEEAFDPDRNVAYAAGYLSSLKAEHRSWTKAIGLYHSNTPRFNGPYRLKVFRAWREERHRANRTRLAARSGAIGQPGSGYVSAAAAAQQGQNLGGIGRPLGPVGGAQAPLVLGLRVGAGRQ